MASVLRKFALRPISNLFSGTDMFLAKLGARKLRKLVAKLGARELKNELISVATDKLLELLLRAMGLYFYLCKDDYQKNLKDFEGRYFFRTADNRIVLSAIFKDGGMKVYSQAIDDWDVRITFKDGTAIRNFIFSEDKDILDRVRCNDVEVDGNLNYMYKFRFMCRDISRRLDLVTMGPKVYDHQTVRQFLAAERRATRRPVSKLILGLIASLAAGVFMFALPVGLMVIWFYKSFGLQLFLAAGIAGIVLMVVRQFLKTYLLQLDGSRKVEKPTRPETDTLEERIDRYEVFETLPLIGVVLGTLPGFIWLSYSVFVAHKISLPSLVLFAIPCLTWTGLKVIDLCREFWYFSHLLRLSDRFEHEVLSDRGIPISPREVDLLSQVEMRQMARRIARTQETFSQQEWYSIFVEQKAIKLLNDLPDEQYEKRYAVRDAIRKVIDSLQLNAHPAEARATSERENEFFIIIGNYKIIYVVDSGKKRVNVTDIHDTRQEEVLNAS